MANNSGLSKRAALKQQQELEERRKRNSRILGFSLGGIGLVVVVIVAIVIFQTIGQSGSRSENQIAPPNATEGYGIELVSQDAEPAADAPHVVLYEDFQCPACKAREEAYGPAFNQLIDQGEITLEIRFATFLEINHGNDASTRAAQAAAAADSVGKFREYHSYVYSQQGVNTAGYSDQQLRVDFPAAVGIEGEDLTKFQELYDTEAFADFVENSNEMFNTEGIGSTPTYLVGDKRLEFFDTTTEEILIQPTPDDVLRAIKELAG
ncbi:DsbA family protein [Tessaracoccus sp. OS52]|uniref:DsbA family protein n=1 Tax=Tessaracoccus sp. OS52 TaxID=2886691 RepID=UPI001D100388|nr:thioredoxin domain-containing protein [Tessaracoccus sp. OS52]MCC2592584.1 DsbA family protein [Tessaracoccus sp. OS52]